MHRSQHVVPLLACGLVACSAKDYQVGVGPAESAGAEAGGRLGGETQAQSAGSSGERGLSTGRAGDDSEGGNDAQGGGHSSSSGGRVPRGGGAGGGGRAPGSGGAGSGGRALGGSAVGSGGRTLGEGGGAGGSGGRPVGEGGGAGGVTASTGYAGAPPTKSTAADTLEVELEGDLVLQREATATVYLLGSVVHDADAGPSVIVQTKAPVIAVPAAVRLQVPSEPGKLVAGAQPGDEIVYSVSAELDVDQDSRMCGVDYTARSQGGPGESPDSIETTLRLEPYGSWYQCGNTLALDLSGAASETLADGARARVLLGGNRVDGAHGFDLVVDEQFSLTELPATVNVAIPPGVEELLGHDPSEPDSQHPSYTLEALVDADGDGLLCPEDLAGGPDPIELDFTDRRWRMPFPLYPITADQGCTALPGAGWAVGAGGYVTVGNIKGYAWTAWEGEATTMLPPNFRALGASDRLCVSGKVPESADYSSFAMLGVSLNQPYVASEDIPEGDEYMPTGSGLRVAIDNVAQSPLRLVLQGPNGVDNDAQRWCRDLPPERSAGGSFDWSDFTNDCWEPAGEAYDPSKPITVLLVLVPGRGAGEGDVHFDFCLRSFEEI
jgi:hypothetical protein